MTRIFSSLHARLAFVVLLAVAAPFAALWSTAAQWRQHEATEAQATALRIARHASSIHGRLVTQSARSAKVVSEDENAPGDQGLYAGWLDELLNEATLPAGTTLSILNGSGTSWRWNSTAPAGSNGHAPATSDSFAWLPTRAKERRRTWRRTACCACLA